MAHWRISLPESWYQASGNAKRWSPPTDDRPSIPAALRDDPNAGAHLARLQYRKNDWACVVHITSAASGAFSADNAVDLSDNFEAAGVIRAAAAGEVFDFRVADATADTAEPYVWRLPSSAGSSRTALENFWDALSGTSGEDAGAAIFWDGAGDDPFTALSRVSVEVVDAGAAIEITYDRALDDSSVPSTGNYTAQLAGARLDFDGVSISGATVRLTPLRTIPAGETLNLWYSGTAIRDEFFNVAGTFAGVSVRNVVSLSDITPIDIPIGQDAPVTLGSGDSYTNTPSVTAVAGQFERTAAGASVTLTATLFGGSSAILNFSPDVGGDRRDFADLIETQAVLSLTVGGVAASGTIPMSGDRAVPYIFTLPEAWVTAMTAATASGAIVFHIGEAPAISDVRIAGIGTIPVHGAAALTVTPNAAPDIRIAGIGTVTVYGAAALRVTSDVTAPTLASASLANARGDIALTFDEPLDEGAVPPAGRFSVLVGGAARSVTAVAIDGATVTLTLASAAAAADAVTVSYTPGANAARRLKDPHGNEVAAFSGQAVANPALIGDVTPIVVDTGRSGLTPLGSGTFYSFSENLVALAGQFDGVAEGATVVLSGSLLGGVTPRITLTPFAGTTAVDFADVIERLGALQLWIGGTESGGDISGGAEVGSGISLHGDTEQPYNYDLPAAWVTALETFEPVSTAEFSGTVPGVVETELAGVSIADDANARYLIRVGGGTVTAVAGNTLYTATPGRPVTVSGVRFYSKGGADAGKLYAAPNANTAHDVEVRSVADWSGSSAIRFRIAERSDIRIAGIGVSPVYGAAALTVTRPPEVRVAGIGATPVYGSAGPLTVTPPSDIRVAGVGSVGPVGGTAALTVTPPPDIRIAGIGTVGPIGGSAALTVDTIGRLFPHEGTLAKSGSWWNESPGTIPAAMTTGSATQALNVRVAGSSGSRVLRVRLSGDSTVDFSDSVESVARIALWNGSSADGDEFLIDVPLAGDPDRSSIYNIPISNARYNAINGAGNTLYYRLHIAPAVRIVAVGTVGPVGGTAALTVTPPPDIRIAGIGAVTVQGRAALTVTPPPDIRIAGIGTVTVGGRAGLTVRRHGSVDIRISGIGSVGPIGGSAALTVTGAGDIRISGVGLVGPIGGRAVLTVTPHGHPDIRIAGIGTVGPVGGMASLTVALSAFGIWPSNVVPDEILARGFRQAPGNNVVRFAVERGMARRRPRYTGQVRRTAGIVPMTDAQWEDFLDWYDDRLNGGERKFYIPDPMRPSGLILVEFAAPPSRVRRPGHWDVTLNLRQQGAV